MLNMFSRFSLECKKLGFVYKDVRSTAILAMALLSLRMTTGYLLAPPHDDSGAKSLTFLENFAPLYVFGYAWFICFLVCLFQAFRKRDAICMVFFAVFNLLWGLSYMYDWIFSIAHGEYSRAWFTGWYYLVLAALPAAVVSRITNPYALELEREKGNVIRWK